MYSTPYASALETQILAATPVELIQLLYDGALGAVQTARRHLAEGLIRERGLAVSKAVAILTELAMSLDYQGGGEISRRLGALYDYMQRTLLEANFRQADEGLREVQGLLATLRDGWRELTPAESAGSGARCWHA